MFNFVRHAPLFTTLSELVSWDLNNPASVGCTAASTARFYSCYSVQLRVLSYIIMDFYIELTCSCCMFLFLELYRDKMLKEQIKYGLDAELGGL